MHFFYRLFWIFNILFYLLAAYSILPQDQKKPTNEKLSKKEKENLKSEKESLLKEKEILAKEKGDIEKNKEFLAKEKKELESQKEDFQKQKEEFEKTKTLHVKTEEPKEEDFFKLEEDISIVSKKVGQSENTSKTSAIVSVYNRQKISDSGARNLADILKQAPGVEISYDQFGFYKVAFRGVQSSSGVLMLLDGHRINNFYDGSTFLDIRADAIEKVEIIRGPGSSIHGTNAFVGVINVITRSAAKNDKSGGHVSSRLGQYNTFEPTAYYNLKLGEEWRLGTYAGYFESKRPEVHLPFDQSCTSSEYKVGNCTRTAIPQPLNSSVKTNDRKKQTNLFITLKKGESFYIKGKMLRQERGPNVGELGIVTPDSQLGFNLLTADLGTEKLVITPTLSLSGRVYTDSYIRRDEVQVERRDYLAHFGSSPIKKSGYQYQTAGTEVILQYNPFSQVSILLGAQMERLTYKDAFIKQNYIGGNTSTLYPAFYDYDNLTTDVNDTTLQFLTTGKASISDPDNLKKGKTRTRNIHAQFINFHWEPVKWLSITSGVRRDTYSDFGSTINPKTGLVITPFEKTKFGSLSFKILYGSAFRAPTFQELYDKNQAFQQGGVFGNGTQRFQTFGQAGYGNLKPETIRTGEVGLEYQTPYKPLVFQVNYFYTRIYNNIEGVNTSGAFPGKTDIYRNLRGRTIIGSEAEFKLNYTSRNYIFLNMSWFQAIDNGGMTPGLNADNKTFLTNIPQGRANLGINWELTKYFVLNNTIWASSERYSNARFPFERISTRGFRFPQYHIWNVSLATTEEVLTNMELRLSIFNLQNYKLYDDSNTAIESYSNRAIPAAYIFQRYIEFKMTYFLL